jgi:hypothetical protein
VCAKLSPSAEADNESDTLLSLARPALPPSCPLLCSTCGLTTASLLCPPEALLRTVGGESVAKIAESAKAVRPEPSSASWACRQAELSRPRLPGGGFGGVLQIQMCRLVGPVERADEEADAVVCKSFTEAFHRCSDRDGKAPLFWQDPEMVQKCWTQSWVFRANLSAAGPNADSERVTIL